MSSFDNLIDELRLLYPDEPLSTLYDASQRLIDFFKISIEHEMENKKAAIASIGLENVSDEIN